MKDLGRSSTSTGYYLYCDSSAFEHVTKYKDRDGKVKRLPSKDQYWKSTRGPSDKVFRWYDSIPDLCKDEDGNDIDAFSRPSQGLLIMCPRSWRLPSSKLCDEGVQHSERTHIESMITTGSVMYHELTHLRLGTKDRAYGFGPCYDLARRDPDRVNENADSMMLFAIAMLYNKNDWSTGRAKPLPRG